MPNRKTHVTVGAIAGCTHALYRARNEKPFHLLLEALGGLVGGYIGGRFPDIVDPPTSPNHRSIGHGVLPNATLSTIYYAQLGDWQRRCREQANKHRLKQKQAQSIWSHVKHGFLGALCRIFSGFLSGFAAGHTSHLALDMTTPRRLPLIS